ncbi:MAG: hypothetical protein RI907_3656 [Pseudomonadota bacterium]|jgi:LemA protein
MSGGQVWWVGLGGVLLLWAVGAYSRLQKLRGDIQAAFANLDTQLQRRHGVVPAVQATLRPLLPHTHDALERLQAASSQVMAATQLVKGHPHQSGPIQACSMAEDLFQEAHARLVEAVSACDLQDEATSVNALLDELQQADNQARFARGLHNDAAAAFNEAAALWPTRALARLAGLQPAASLALSPSRIDASRAVAPTPAPATTA